MAEPVLKLEILTERSTVTVDSVPYDLVNPGELSMYDTYRVERLAPRVETLYRGIENLTDDAVREMAELLRTLVGIIFLAPAEIQERLTDNQRLRILQVFSDLQRDKVTAPAGENLERKDAVETSTGESS